MLEELYREVILDHHRQPRGRTPLAGVDATADGYNPSCGDSVQVNLQVEAGRITGIQVETEGCAISTAAGSMLAEVAKGLTLAEFVELNRGFLEMLKSGEEPDEPELGDLGALVGVHRFAVRVKCATLAVHTALEALASSGFVAEPYTSLGD